MRVRSGELNRRIQLQRHVGTKDTWGDLRDDWVNFGSPLWAKVRPSSESGTARDEFVAGDIEVSQNLYDITIRRRAGVTAKMRILHRAEIFDIVKVIRDQDRNEWMILVAVSRGTIT